MAGRGEARRGLARQGEARPGLARQGEARRGKRVCLFSKNRHNNKMKDDKRNTAKEPIEDILDDYTKEVILSAEEFVEELNARKNKKKENKKFPYKRRRKWKEK